MDWSEIWRGELLRYTDAIGSRIFYEIFAQIASPYCPYEEGKVIEMQNTG